jgi:AcrR family transcriptional regulator
MRERRPPVTKGRGQRKSELTRARILEAALALFRKHGLESTTMRDVAEAAGLSLGAAYYYFPSKEAILLAYYSHNQDAHEERARMALKGAAELRHRLGILMHTKLDSIQKERKLLGSIVQRLADPSDPISAFAEETSKVRQRAIALFASALDGQPLPDDLKTLLGPALWFLHMGFLLYFVHDPSPKQARTRQLVDDTLDFLVPLIALGATHATAPLRAQLKATLSRAGLLPT